MGSEILDVGTFRGPLDNVPDGFRREACTPYFFQFAYSPEECTCTYLGCIAPLINCAFRPHGNWNGADVFSFTNQVGDHPVFLADLKIFESESYEFGASQTAPNEQR